ncbi:MAG: carboxypeptidase-like regulatory domain-containing protein [Dehalococcoidia bacterium]
MVLDNSNVPIPGVTASIEGTTLQAVTDAQGQFSIPNVPVGAQILRVDGSTTTRPGAWPALEFEIDIIPGQDNTIGMPIFLLPLDAPNAKIVGGSEDVTLIMQEVPGFSLTVFANSATFPDGSTVGQVMATQVHSDKVPMPPIEGAAPGLVWTIQPAGVIFDPPARITYPNVDNLKPGQVVDLFSFDHDLGEFVSIGTGTVSEDGSVITSDPGLGIPKSGWGYARTPPDPTTDVTNDADGDGFPDVEVTICSPPDPNCLNAAEEGVDIRAKADVDIQNLRPEIRSLLDDVVGIFKEQGMPVPVITSGNDSTHPGSRAPGTDCSSDESCKATSNSLHYKDLAVDIRANNIPDAKAAEVAQLLKERLLNLDPRYFVLFEQPRFGKPDYNPAEDHFHIQFDTQ